MPLPALDLDTRRWDDLVEEARSLIPRLAPGWTDHNLHDPGMTLLELLAYVVEQDIYRVNRVPERHRRKFLRLAGFAPAPPRAASGVAAFALRDGAAPLTLPAGLAVGSPDVRLRLRDALTVTRARIAAVQSFDGIGFVDLTRSWRGGQPVAALGTESGAAADRHPALLIGFDQSLPVGTAAMLWLAFAGRVASERERIAAELGAAGSEHHSLRTIWEYHDGTDWRALNAQAGEVDDATRALSLDGAVRVALPAPMIPSVQGVFDTALCWLRCRVLAGAPDVPPRLTALAVNAVAVEQRSAARQTFTLAPGPALPGAVMPGSRGRLHLDLDADGAVTALLFGPAVDGPEVLVLEHAPRTPVRAGALTVTLVLAGRGTGEPRQCLELPEGIVADDAPTVWTDVPWAAREDLDAARRTDAVFRLEPTASLLCFGDGERGRVVGAGTPVLAAYDLTDGSAGNGRPAAPWGVAGVDDAWNDALLGAPAATVEAAVTVAPLVVPGGGADAESTAGAAGRAVASLWAHERLLELCPPGGPQTLDQVPQGRVLERIAPQRASTLLDFERIALDVAGVAVRRARAWAGAGSARPVPAGARHGHRRGRRRRAAVAPAARRRAPGSSSAGTSTAAG